MAVTASQGPSSSSSEGVRPASSDLAAPSSSSSSGLAAPSLSSDPINHKRAAGSCSGAGLWLSTGSPSAVADIVPAAAGTSSSEVSSAPPASSSPPPSDDYPVLDKDSRSPRTYHFPAGIVAAGARSSGIGKQQQQWELMSAGLSTTTDMVRPSSSSDRVDLDLSFDFLSDGEDDDEDKGLSRAAPVVVSPTPATAEVAIFIPPVLAAEAGSSRPRGMAESMSRSNSRKKPPKPLAFLKKVSSAGLKSTFSPETPSIVIRPAEEEEEPLPTKPLSATRRANDSNIQPSGSSSGAIVRRRARTLSDAQPPPSSPPTTPLPPLPMAAFANLSSAIKKPKSTPQLQQSDVPFPTSADLDAAAAAAATASSQPLANGKPAPRTLRKPLRNSASSIAVLDHQPLSAPLDSSSCATAEASDAPPRKPLRQKLFGRSSSSSIDKLASYLSSSPSTELSPGGNSLGLDLGRPSATPSPQNSGEEATTTSSELSPSSSRPGGLSLIIAALPLPATGGDPSAAPPLNPAALSPASKNHSSPETPMSSMFDSRDTRSDWSKATSDVAGTPKSTSFPMQKGPSGTGASASALMTGVIFEEPLEELRQANGGQSGMTRSETAEWIRAQQEAAAASQASGSGGSAQRSSISSSSAGSTSSAEVFAPAAEELPSVAPLNIVKGASVPAPSVETRELPESETIAGLGLFFDAKDTAPAAPGRLNSVLTIGEQRTDSSGATSPDVIEVRRVALDMPRPPPSALLFNEPEGKNLLVRHNSDDAASASGGASFGVVEPFAHNATRPSTGKGQQGGSNARSVTDPVGRPRFGSRLWSSLYSGKRDSSTATTAAAAPLRSLTLVRLQERQEGLPASRRHSVGQTAADGDESQDSLHVIGQALIDPPNTAPLPSVEFPSATAVPTTFERSKRSSKHVRRSSTIKYNPSRRADETRLNIGSQSSELPQTEFTDSTSPRVAEGYTPDMVYGTNGRRSRLSWGYNPPTPKTESPAQADSSLTHGDVEADSSRLSAGSRATTPTSPFLDFEEDGRGLQATRDRTRSLLAQRQQQQEGSESIEFSQGASSSSAFDSDGLRRRPTVSESQRYSHRSSYSTPPVAATASVRPFLSRVDRRASLHADVTINQGGRLGHINEGTGLRKLHLAGDLPPAEEAARPLEKLQAHMRQQYQQEAAKRVAERSTQRRKTLVMGGSNNALTFSSNRLLDVDSPARALFFAGFLAMPWLWIIGGWWLTNDGTMTVSEQDDRVRFYTHEASMVAAREQSRREQTPSPRLQQQGRFERGHYHQRGPASTVTRTDGAATSSAWPDLYATDYSMSAQTHTGDAISSSQSSSNESHSLESDVDDDDDTTSEPSLVTDHRRSGYTSGTAAARTNRQSAYTWSARSSGVTGTHDALSRAHSAASSRVLVSSNPNRISRGVRRSIGTLLNPHPEIALFHSPVRTISMDEGVTTAEYAGFTATDSRSRLSHSSSSEDHHRRSRAGERQQDRRQKRMPLGLDDSGLDLITDIDEEDEEGSTLNDDDDTDDIHAAYQRQQNYNDHAEVDQRYSTGGSYAAATQVKLTFAESLALMDRFVLMNRVMSIVSTCVVFAGVGLALNVVVENF